MRLYRRKGSPFWWVSLGSRDKRIRQSLKTTDRAEAQALAYELYRKHYQHGHRREVAETLTVGELVAEMLARAVKEHWYRPQTMHCSYRPRWELLAERFGPVKCSDLSGLDIFNWILGLDHSNATRRAYLRTISALFSRAWKLGYLADNPLRDFRPSGLPKAPKPKPCVLTDEERTKLLKAAKGHWLEPPIMLALHTGMRFGEMVNADWGDIGWERKIIAVKRKPARDWLPKSHQEREIPLPEVYYEYLKDRRVMEAKTPLCVNLKGGRMAYNPLPALKKLCVEAGVPPVGWHVFRHTFTNILLRANLSIYKVSLILGHSSVVVTQERYAHLVPGGLSIDVSAAFREKSACPGM